MVRWDFWYPFNCQFSKESSSKKILNSVRNWQNYGYESVTPFLAHPVHPFNSLFSRTTWLSRYQKWKTSLDLNEARDDGVWGWQLASVGPYANNLHLSAPHSRQITAPTPHHSIFTDRKLSLTPNQQCKKHWRHKNSWSIFQWDSPQNLIPERL